MGKVEPFSRAMSPPDPKCGSRQGMSGVEWLNAAPPPERLLSLLTRQVFLFDM